MIDSNNIKRINKELIIEELASKYGLTEREVADMVNSQFKFVAKVMDASEFDGVQLPSFCKFHVLDGRLKQLNIRKIVKEQKKKDGN